MHRLRQEFGSHSVLIIDDDFQLAHSLSRILKMFFAECVIAGDGESGYQYFEERFDSSNPFALVVTDLELPKIGGLGLIQKIRSRSKTQPVFILSAHDEAKFLAEAISLDVQSYLIKPLSMPKLFESLDKIRSSCSLSEKPPINLIDSVTKLPILSEFDSLTPVFRNATMILIRIHIDHLAYIQNFIGKEYSDNYLCQLLQILEELVQDISGKFFRCTSDEICLLLENQTLEYAKKLASDIIGVARHFHTSEHGIIVTSTLSIGIAEGKKLLLPYSKIALENRIYQTIEGIGVFSENDHQDSLELRGKDALQMIFDALEEENIIPYFQPIFDVKNNTPVIYESLVRIKKNGFIYGPDSFLQVASNTNQMAVITRSMIRKSYDFLARHDSQTTVSIRLSLDDLHNDGLLSFIKFCNDWYAVPPSSVVFNVTSWISSDLSQHAFATILELKSYGHQILISDFGASHLDISLLIDIQPDFIKLHANFATEILTQPLMLPILQKLVDVIHLIGSQSVITHVSDAKLIDIIPSIGVGYIQGNALGVPFEMSQ